MLKVKFKFFVSDKYIDLLQSKKYEPIILSILKDSKKIFTGKYTHIDIQSNGESDFVEKKNDEQRYIDSKILFYKQMCAYIAQDNLKGFIDEFEKEYNEIFDCIKMPNYYTAIENTRLFKEIVNILENKIKKNEDLILFLPFPFSHKSKSSLVASLGSDNIEMVCNQIKNRYPDLIGNRYVYLIVNNIENQTVIYDLSNSSIYNYEIIDNNYIDSYVKFQIKSDRF